MRSSKSRSRNKNNRNRNNNSLGNVVNRVFDSNGPEGKVRGTPQQIIDKYNQLARDSALGNDRVATENFQQHAEHYLRLLSAAQKEQEAKREQQERENRERQAQRDRERAERDAARAQREGETDSEQPQAEVEASERPQRKPRRNEQPAGTGDQPDVIDVKADDDGPGLVETPESKAQTAPDAEAPAEAAEEKPKPKKPRAPRKPRAKKPAPEAEAEATPAEEKAPKAETPPDAAE